MLTKFLLPILFVVMFVVSVQAQNVTASSSFSGAQNSTLVVSSASRLSFW